LKGLTVAEYFAGIGLVRMGLEAAGWKVVFANDIEPKKAEIYRRLFSNGKDIYVVGDIFDLKAKDIPETTLATCSFPCVDLSLAGNRQGLSGKKSGAFWGFVKILREQGENRPQMVLIENVPGLLSSHRGEDFKTLIGALEELGYSCEWMVIDAARFTAQSRRRVFIVGERGKKKEERRNAECGMRNAGLPEIGKYRVVDMVEKIPEDDERWWEMSKVERHIGMMSDKHRKIVEELQTGDTFSYRTFFRRVRKEGQRVEVRNDELAGCLRTIGGGSGRQFLIRAGRGDVQMRSMTVREYARLQGVPDRYEIGGSEVFALSALGDAVCAPVIEWIGRNLKFEI